jgi:hypothetical protein
MAVRYLGTNSPDGTCLGYDDEEKISFYGETPVVQPADGNQEAIGDLKSTTTATTSTLLSDCTTIKTLVNQLRSDLVTLGLIKGGA